VGDSLPFLELWVDTPHNPSPGGLCPLDPLWPALVGLGFAGVLGPTRGGVANVGDSLPFLELWVDTPHNPPPGGLRPLDPPFAHPRGLRVCRRFAPLRGGEGRAPPNFPPSLAGKGARGLGRKGTFPKLPGRELRPIHSLWPTPAGFGFASVLGPTRGGVEGSG
jgi:hypothetical protein